MPEFDILDVMKSLPHRSPFLLVDRVLQFEPYKSLTAIKNVTINEPFFEGHFPHYPIMPGVLILEALAQACGLLAVKSYEGKLTENDLFLFAGIDKVRFKQGVHPGDQLKLEVALLKQKQDVYKFSAEASVDGQLVCTAELMSARREIQRDQ